MTSRDKSPFLSIPGGVSIREDYILDKREDGPFSGVSVPIWMVTTLLPSNVLSMSSSTSTCNTKSSLAATPGIKIAPLIRQANVVSYEQRQGKTWFIIQVTPQQLQHLPPSIERNPYTISRRYDDCVQFCQRLYDAFPCLSFHNKGRTPSHHQQHYQQHHQQNYSYDLPKLKPQGFLNKKQPNGQRRAELDRFVQSLFRLPAAITQTLIVLEFFGLQKDDTEQQVLRDRQNVVRQQAITTTFHPSGGGNDDSYSFLDDHFQSMLLPENAATATNTTLTNSSSKWTSKFRTFRGRSSSANSLSSFCYQAAHRLPWSAYTSNTTADSLFPLKKKSSFNNNNTTTITTTMPILTSSSNSSATSSNSVSTTSQPPSPPHHHHYHHHHHHHYATLSDVGRQQQQHSGIRTSHCSNQSGLTSMSSSSTSTSSYPTMALSAIAGSTTTGASMQGGSSGVRIMKLKVIYDVDNIVVIQIPRSTNLAALRTRLHDKFSTMLDRSLLADQFVLLYNENTRSSSSSSGFSLDQVQLSSSSSSSSSSDLLDASSILPSSPSITLISSEEQWTKAMQSWDSFEKVTLRCIH
ncbi:hypothetical protein BCR42DRAFT_478353 [Absidia repens]|uniref:PX domain-containing protein n=1 Tax=Absidia repens TaxID=90262 RepID=A0A1X2IKX4_9FUNG|nr:hypothetical protein BCR42DRAFT_478353 [Absidia repens]